MRCCGVVVLCLPGRIGWFCDADVVSGVVMWLGGGME